MPGISEKKDSRRLRILGGLAVSFFALHAGFHAWHGRPYDILWNCTLSNALIGIGLFCRRSRPVAVGVTWLCMGTLTWLADVLCGGEFFATSTLTHFGGLTVGILGIRLLGWPPRTWIWATLGMLALQGLSRLFTPPHCNINLAFSVYAGWERYYPSYRLFWLAMFTEAVFIYYIADRLAQRLARQSSRRRA